jgi:hypothetical protein
MGHHSFDCPCILVYPFLPLEECHLAKYPSLKEWCATLTSNVVGVSHWSYT